MAPSRVPRAGATVLKVSKKLLKGRKPLTPFCCLLLASLSAKPGKWLGLESSSQQNRSSTRGTGPAVGTHMASPQIAEVA